MGCRLKAALGAVFVAAGLSVLIATSPPQATAGVPGPAAREGARDWHAVMDRMMEVAHGSETVARIHRIEGVEEMMDQCAAMMESMGEMSGMMRGPMGGRMMEDMMGR